jgi:hypothetical protein
LGLAQVTAVTKAKVNTSVDRLILETISDLKIALVSQYRMSLD